MTYDAWLELPYVIDREPIEPEPEDEQEDEDEEPLHEEVLRRDD